MAYQKRDFVRDVAERSQLPQDTVKKLLAAMTLVAAERVAVDGEVRIPGIVKMNRCSYKARPARNPKTGEPCVIPPHSKTRIRPVTSFEELVGQTAETATAAA